MRGRETKGYRKRDKHKMNEESENEKKDMNESDNVEKEIT